MVLDDRFHSEPPAPAEVLQCRQPVAARCSADCRVHIDAAWICLHTVHCFACSGRHYQDSEKIAQVHNARSFVFGITNRAEAGSIS